MAPRRIVRLVLVGVGALLVTLLVGGTAVTTVYVRKPFPDTTGEVAVSGLRAVVTVLRDARGVPSVYADTAEDLFRAQGFVQAQDRFFEMDWRRHVTAGRISELVGADPDALLADKVVRTLGWRRVATAELGRLDPASRRWLDAYSAGVNDYLASRSRAELSLQYSVLGLSVPLGEVEPWTPVDSLAWFKAMSWDLRGNYDAELARALAYGAVKDVGRVEQLYPPFPGDLNPTVLQPADDRSTGAKGSPPGSAATDGAAAQVAAAQVAARQVAARQVAAALAGAGAGRGDGVSAARALEAARRAVRAVPDLLGARDGTGSNAWAVAGTLTASGKPLLANDPHLSPSMPGIWYQTGLHCRRVGPQCPFDVAGFTFAGVPGVVIGHTARFAWGMTNLGPDVTDFYLEKVDGDTVERDGTAEPLTVRTETIRVAGAVPVALTVRSSAHGPLLSDVLDDVARVGRTAPVSGTGGTAGSAVADGAATPTGAGYAVALAWTALTPGRDMDAIFAVDAATDFASFRRGVLLMDTPAQNFVYADAEGDHGHIGYQAPGRIPLRRSVSVPAGGVPADGTWPLPGWDSRYDWTGFADTDRLPWTLDPAPGVLVTANQPPTAGSTQQGAAVRLGDDFDYGWRARRITDLLAAATKDGRLVTASDLQAIQRDARTPLVDVLVPSLLRVPLDDSTEQGRRLLRGWDGAQGVDSPAAAYLNAVWASLLDLTFSDELPEGARPNGGGRWVEVVRRLLAAPKDRWWDDRRTPGVVETRDEMLRQALVDARLRLTREQGKDPTAWRWGALHTVRFELSPLGSVGATAPLHPLMNEGTVGLAGGPAAVDATSYDAASGTFEVVSAPSMRMVVDLSDLDRSRWVDQTGQSAHPGHPNYSDQLDAWSEGRTFPWPFGEEAVRAAAEHEQRLVPPR